MSTHLDGHEFHLPPPVDTSARLELLDHGDGRLRFVRDAREVGWLEDRAVGFRGYPDADAARAAATAAYSTLSRWTARQSRTAPVPARRRPLSCRHDGVTEWLTLGGLPIGRLLRFTPYDIASDDAAACSDVGFELMLPARVTGELRLRAARAIERSLGARPLSRMIDRDVGRELATIS